MLFLRGGRRPSWSPGTCAAGCCRCTSPGRCAAADYALAKLAALVSAVWLLLAGPLLLMFLGGAFTDRRLLRSLERVQRLRSAACGYAAIYARSSSARSRLLIASLSRPAGGRAPAVIVGGVPGDHADRRACCGIGARRRRRRGELAAAGQPGAASSRALASWIYRRPIDVGDRPVRPALPGGRGGRWLVRRLRWPLLLAPLPEGGGLMTRPTTRRAARRLPLVRQRGGGQRRHHDARPGRHRAARPERRRQDHAAAHDGRLPRPVARHGDRRRRSRPGATRRSTGRSAWSAEREAVHGFLTALASSCWPAPSCTGWPTRAGGRGGRSTWWR